MKLLWRPRCHHAVILSFGHISSNCRRDQQYKSGFRVGIVWSKLRSGQLVLSGNKRNLPYSLSRSQLSQRRTLSDDSTSLFTKLIHFL
ncbi:unnamed protein product [Clavelina lepadiformis]|uniref:Uncharacterized protein n=1 Tax=Clavelina lepadiformis TaxID=159417 RepID=A0ABP0F1B4_CLALP